MKNAKYFLEKGSKFCLSDWNALNAKNFIQKIVTIKLKSIFEKRFRIIFRC